MKSRKYTLLFLTLLFSSCIINGPSGFVLKYEGKYTGLDTLINIDGYYQTEKFVSNEDKRYAGIMFFSDGSVCAVTSIEPSLAFQADGNPAVWGSYVISGDTIKVQTILNLGLMGGLHTNRLESGYYIIDSTNKLKRYIYDKNDFVNGERIYSFHPLENRIDSTNWLFDKKWFWKNKKAYKEYKKNKKKTKRW